MQVNLDGSNQRRKRIEGFWPVSDRKHHINYIKLLAVKLAITADYNEIWQGCKPIRTKANSITDIGYVNNMEEIILNSCNI